MSQSKRNIRVSSLVEYEIERQVQLYSSSSLARALYADNDNRYVTTSSFTAYTGSFSPNALNVFSASINTFSASMNIFSASMNIFSASLNTFTSSVKIFTASLTSYSASVNLFTASVKLATASFANFAGTVSITGNLAALATSSFLAINTGINQQINTFSGSTVTSFASIVGAGGNIIGHRIYHYRVSSSLGGGWSGTDTYVQKYVDSTQMGFVGFYGSSGIQGATGVGLGYGSVGTLCLGRFLPSCLLIQLAMSC